MWKWWWNQRVIKLLYLKLFIPVFQSISVNWSHWIPNKSHFFHLFLWPFWLIRYLTHWCVTLMCQNQSEKSSKTANLHFDCTVIEIIKQQKRQQQNWFQFLKVVFCKALIISLKNTIYCVNEMYNKESTDILWLAFDTINYRLPMKKLGIYNINGIAHSWPQLSWW